MSYDIGMNYGELDAMDTTLDKQIQDFYDSYEEFFNAVEVTRDYWKGTTAEGSIQSIYEFKPELQKLLELLEAYRNVINISENNHKETENDNIQRARNLEF